MRCLPAALIALSLLLGATARATASGLKSDEEILFFRTGAALDPGAGSWTMPVRGWVFEPERNSLKRRLLLKALVKTLGLPPGSDVDAIFRARAEMFLVDSESRKDITVRVGGKDFDLPRTASDGVLAAELSLASTAQPPGGGDGTLRYAAVLPDGDDRRFEGTIRLVPPEGLGVISDIDDTLKVTHVLDRKEMLRNTFLRPFAAVPGMAARYAQWAAAGAAFHYVSGSPMHLYPSLVGWMDETGFPQGGMHLRNFWGDTEEAAGVAESSAEHKPKAIGAILRLHPRRRFVLVGDSGEHDPEIYAEVARANPGRIARILIRKAPGADESAERYQAAFQGLPGDLWKVFGDEGIPDLR